MAVPKGHEIEYEGEVYVLVDSDLFLKLTPGKGACHFCELRTPCGTFDCLINGPEIGIYVKKLAGGNDHG